MNVGNCEGERAPATATYGSLGRARLTYQVLSVLWESDGRTIGEVADKLSPEPSTVTPLVKKLKIAGFLRRARNRDNERQVNVGLTDNGKAIQGKAKCLTEALLDRTGLFVADTVRLNRGSRRPPKWLTAPADHQA
jgi:DNA-binding MarR family transcriptional regulator